MIKLLQFVTESGKLPVQEHYDDANESLQVAFDVSTDYLLLQPRLGWRRDWAAKLSRQGKGYRDFYEIRFKSGGLQQRPIGFFYPDDQTFILLIWATEKGNELKPTDWHSIADKRRKQIESGRCTPQLFKRGSDEDEVA